MGSETWMRRPAVRVGLYVVVVVAGVHAVAALALLGLQRAHTDAVLNNVEVDGSEVGGLDRAALEEAVADRATERLGADVAVTAGDARHVSDAADAGLEVDTAATADAAWDQGRRGLWRALAEQVAARLGVSAPIELRTELDEERLGRWARATAQVLSHPPAPASVSFEVVDPPDDVVVETADAHPGRAVDHDEIAERVSARLHEPGPAEVEVAVRTVPPATTAADVDAVRADARRAVSAPVELTNPSAAEELVLPPAGIAEVLAVEHDDDAPDGERLRLAADGEALRAHLGEDGLERLRASPVEAELELVGDDVTIHGGTPGFDPDVDETATRVLELATRQEERTGELPGEERPPELTRQEAEDLEVVEEVSSFTTDLVPGESRNTNIHLGADYLDHALILPGETFSLNEAIGPRTRERGFVENGFIDEDGELTEVVGGGSSQLGTTFLNAAWFAGIQIDEFQPHSYYFDRYPMGREATLSYGAIDVVVTNDSPYGLLVVTSHTDASVTMRIFSSSWAEVDSWTGQPYDRVPGVVRDGFAIDFGRDIAYPDGTSTSESYHHRYQAEE